MNSNYVYKKGDLLVAPGGGGAFTPLLVGSDGAYLVADSSQELGLNWSSNVPDINQVFTIGLSSIDLTKIQTILFYTPPVNYFFMPIFQFWFYSVFSGYSAGTVFSMGTNATSYNNYQSVAFGNAQGAYIGQGKNYVSSTFTSLASNSTPIYLKNSSGAIGTSLIGSVYLQGVLMPS